MPKASVGKKKGERSARCLLREPDPAVEALRMLAPAVAVGNASDVVWSSVTESRSAGGTAPYVRRARVVIVTDPLYEEEHGPQRRLAEGVLSDER